ncbi:MAG: nicotinate (nicotinamide) nucleotide adenylyltransferase [Victivallaceae bacterium]|nr:nicotinate (nicotinamide) nucleotide adenylyltransferase [Victivallaceae bacterium]
MKIAYFGGTFDPVHNGHLAMGRCALEKGFVEKVLFAPAYTPPHKESGRIASYSDRCEMLRLALGNTSGMELCTVEEELALPKSYTLDVLRYLARKHPEHRYLLLLGSDSVRQLSTWSRPHELLAEFGILWFARRDSLPDEEELGRDFSDAELEIFRKGRIEAPFFEISSTKVRSMIAKCESVRHIIPREEEQYIMSRKIYSGKE